MKLIAMCILFFSSLQLAFAMELVISEQSSVVKNDLVIEEDYKIDLKIIVNNSHPYIFRISRNILQDSSYFRARLKSHDCAELTFHMKSIEVFYNLMYSLHGRSLYFKCKTELLEALILQEKFQFNSLNEKLLSFINKERDLNGFHSSELANILVSMDKSLFPFGKACTKQILDYIRDYHDINKNCSRNEIFKYLPNHPHLREIIEQNIKQANDQIAIGEKKIKEELSALKKRYQKKLFKIADKIVRAIRENGSVINNTFKVSASIDNTNYVIRILNLKYRIESDFYDKKGDKENKHMIIIKGVVPISTASLFQKSSTRLVVEI